MYIDGYVAAGLTLVILGFAWVLASLVQDFVRRRSRDLRD